MGIGKHPWENVPNPFNTKEDPEMERLALVLKKVTKLLLANLKSQRRRYYLFHMEPSPMRFTHLNVEQFKIENCEIYKANLSMSSGA